jgi:hypothetical protein
MGQYNNGSILKSRLERRSHEMLLKGSHDRSRWYESTHVRAVPGWTDSQSVRRLATCPTGKSLCEKAAKPLPQVAAP